MAKKRKSLGKALNLASKQLDELALVTPQDVLDAQLWATQNGTPNFKAFVNAEPYLDPDEAK